MQGKHENQLSLYLENPTRTGNEKSLLYNSKKSLKYLRIKFKIHKKIKF